MLLDHAYIIYHAQVAKAAEIAEKQIELVGAACITSLHDRLCRRIKQQELFCVFKSILNAVHRQYCVMLQVGDLVQTEKLHRREAGEKVVFGTVLVVGSKDFTILGKPTVPYAKVKATIEQQTLTREMLAFWYKPRRKQSHFYRRRQWVTMLRIDEIVLMPEEDPADPPPPKPVRLLDLWANRWLDPTEKEGIEMVNGEDGALIPKTALIYDGSEHQPGSYHRRGLTSCYRYWPDPVAWHEELMT
ncbi:mrpl21 [Symbiodinium natans]|uniref:Large ribosomal subunit protein bL21m n=1 Tax=Symbiodinium natans TaxID=878477 RepID=A0A812NBT3_9DINO|nr:mrpl21 [Symbiodinium natans]